MQFVLDSLLRKEFMYRQHLSQKEMAEQEKQFLTCVGDLPIVQSAWTQVSGIYTKTKEYNPLFNYTLGIAESGVMKVVGTAQPLVQKYDAPIKYVNSVACNQLNNLKTSYPVITKPTDQVLQDGKEKCTALLQPTVNRINAVKDFGVNAYTKSTETVSSVAQTATNYSKNQINRVTAYGEGVVTQALETTYGQVVNDKVNGALELSETYLDKYLPAAETEAKEPVEKSKNALVRAGRVSSKLRRRMYSRAMRDLQNVKVRSTETLQKLNFTIDLIQYAKSNLDGVKTRVGERVEAAQTKFWDTWTEINRDEIDAAGEKGDQNQSLEKRGIVVARHLIHQLRGNLKSLETSMVELPGTLQDKYRGLQEYTDQLWTSVKQMSSVNEVPTWMLNQTRDKLGYIQETMAFLVDQALNSPALSWLVMDVNLDGLDLEEIEHMWTHNGHIVSVNGRVQVDSDNSEPDNQNDINGNENVNNGNQDNTDKIQDANENQNTDDGNQNGIQGN